MNETDLRIFELIKLLQNLGIIKYEYNFGDSVGILKQNLTKIKKGDAHFTSEHIKKMCQVFNVNANWIFGLENKVFNNLKTLKNKEFQEQ